MQCEHIIEYKCPNGHWQKRKCYKSQPQTCRICHAEDERRQKQLEADLELQEKREKENARHEAEIVDLDLQIHLIHEHNKEQQTAKERANALELKKQDLEAAKFRTKGTLARATPEETTNATVATTSNKPSSTDSSASTRQDLESKREKSESEVEWERQKDIEGASNDAIDDLMRLTGLESVKEKFLEIKAKIEAVARKGIDVKKERMGVIMLGNPGTGKFAWKTLDRRVDNQQARQRLLEFTHDFWHPLEPCRGKTSSRLRVRGLHMRALQVPKR